MNRAEYFSIAEDFSALSSIPPRINAMMDMLDMYPNLKSMTCEDALEWLKDRHYEKEQKLQEKLGVGKEDDTDIDNTFCRFLQKVNELYRRGDVKPADHIKMVVSQDNGWHTRNDLPELDDDLNSEVCVVITNNNGYRLKTASVVMGHWSEPNVEWWAYWPYNKK